MLNLILISETNASFVGFQTREKQRESALIFILKCMEAIET